MAESKIDAILALRGDGRSLIGRDRIRLLEAVVEHGSITKAAKAVGLSYKAAWDALNAINNLLPHPVIQGHAGGQHGGGAIVTDQGKALITTFRLIERRLARIAAAFADETIPSDPTALLWSLGMKTSARNAFRCLVAEVKRGPVNTEVVLRLSEAATMAAIITSESVDDLGIEVGREVMALIKSTFILLSPGHEPPRTSARNQLVGTISRREDGPISSEIALDIGGGKTIFAVVTRDSADHLDLKLGDSACAMFKASHVILAVD